MAMVRLQAIRGAPMGNPWDAHGQSVKSQWSGREVTMECPWVVHDALMGGPLAVRGTPMYCLWGGHGLLVRRSFGVRGVSMGRTWVICGAPMACPCGGHGFSMGRPPGVRGASMGGPWGAHEILTNLAKYSPYIYPWGVRGVSVGCGVHGAPMGCP